MAKTNVFICYFHLSFISCFLHIAFLSFIFHLHAFLPSFLSWRSLVTASQLLTNSSWRSGKPMRSEKPSRNRDCGNMAQEASRIHWWQHGGTCSWRLKDIHDPISHGMNLRSYNGLQFTMRARMKAFKAFNSFFLFSSPPTSYIYIYRYRYIYD